MTECVDEPWRATWERVVAYSLVVLGGDELAARLVILCELWESIESTERALSA